MSDDSRHHHHHKKSKKHKRDREDRDDRGDSDASRKSEDSSKKSSEKAGSVEVKEIVPDPTVCPKLIKRITKYLQNWNKDVRMRIFII